MNLEEKKTDSKEVYHGPLLHVFHDTVELPNGKESGRDLIRHIGAVAILPVTDKNEIYIEHQFRYPLGKEIIEIPAGKLDSKDEDPLEAAKRELREETGITAKNWKLLGLYHPAAAYSDEKIYMYVATDLSIGKTDLDEDEFLTVEKVPLEKLVDMVMDGTITDGKTQVGILKLSCLNK